MDNAAESVRPHLRKTLFCWSGGLRDAAISLSLANLCLLKTWRSTIFNGYHEYFFQIPNYAPRYAALLLNLLLLAVTFWLVVFFARKSQKGFALKIVKVAFLAVLLVPLNFVRKSLLTWSDNVVLHYWFERSPITIVLVLFVIVLAITFQHRVAVSAAVIVLLLLPFFAVTMLRTSWSLCKSTWKPVADDKRPPPISESQHQDEPRLLWIIFDELDQRVAFERALPEIELPNLTRFCHGALVATNAFPPAGNTLLSIPALTTGRYLNEAKPVSADQLMLTFADDGTVADWSHTENVFSRAREDDLNTAVIGWFHPYSRVFGSDLSLAHWAAFPSYDSLDANDLPSCLVSQLLSNFWPFYEVSLYARIHADNYLQSIRVVTNAAVGLTMLHLSVPHPPIADNRSLRGQMEAFVAPAQGYLDNLRLTDSTFGALRRVMEEQGLWDKTTVLVSSDHWWRGSKQLDGITDHRVPFIFKLANSTESIVYRKRFNTVISADLVTSVLRKRIQNTSEICAWLDQHESNVQFAYARDGSLMKSAF